MKKTTATYKDGALYQRDREALAASEARRQRAVDRLKLGYQVYKVDRDGALRPRTLSISRDGEQLYLFKRWPKYTGVAALASLLYPLVYPRTRSTSALSVLYGDATGDVAFAHRYIAPSLRTRAVECLRFSLSFDESKSRTGQTVVAENQQQLFEILTHLQALTPLSKHDMSTAEMQMVYDRVLAEVAPTSVTSVSPGHESESFIPFHLA